MPRKLGAERGAVVRLDALDGKRPSLTNLLEELKGRASVVVIVDAQDAVAGGFVGGRELVKAPASSGRQPSSWGTGPTNGGRIGAVKSEVLTGEYSDIGGTPMKFIGAGNPIGPSASAYAVFDELLSARFFFGLAKERFGLEATGKIVEINA